MRSFIVTLLFIIFSFSTSAESIKLCSTSFEPWIVVANNKVTGLSPNLVNLIFSQSGIKEKIELSALPFERCLSGIKDGKYDGVFFLTFVRDREDFLIYTKSYITDESFLFSRTDKPLTKEVLKSPGSYKIGIQRGLKYGQEVDSLINRNPNNFQFTTKNIQLVEMLVRGRIDYFITTKTQFLNIQKTAPKLSKNIHYQSDSPLSSGEYYIGISKISPFKKYVEAINKAIMDIKTSGTNPLAHQAH